MKVVCDVHIPFKLISFLRSKNIEAAHVNNILNSFYTSDKAIADYADKNNLVVITKDIDFRNSYFIQRSLQRVIRICLGNIPTAGLIMIFEKHLDFLIELYQTTPQFYIEISSSHSVMPAT